MKRWWLSARVRLWLLVSLSGCLSAVAIEPGRAEVKPMPQKQEIQSQENFKPLSKKIRQLSEIERPSTSAQMLVLSPVPNNPPQGISVIPITGVKANPSDKGVEVILETPVGTQLQVTNRSTGNNFIADVSGGQLRLANGNAFTFHSEKPIEGITQITVTNIDVNTVRVMVVGEKALPTVELFDDNAGLVFAVATKATATSPQQPSQVPQASQPENQTQPTQPSTGDEPIELVVTGEQDGYRVPDASTVTKTDTPLRDIPQSIQVIPQQVLRDQQVTRLDDALKNVPGVAQSSASSRSYAEGAVVRGFTPNFLRNGLQQNTFRTVGFNSENIERIDVLKGPASVLFGQGSLGATINLVTKQPLREPYYSLEGSVGSFDFYRGAIDFSGPLNAEHTVLYRLNAAAQTTDSFIDFFNQQRYFIASTLTWLLSDRTKLTLQAEYFDTSQTSYDFGLPAVGTVLSNPSGKIQRNRLVTEPSNNSNISSSRIGFDFEHSFSNNWKIHSAFEALFINLNGNVDIGTALSSNGRTLARIHSDINREDQNSYNLDTYAIGKFSTGSIQHQLVTGFNLLRQETPAFKYTVRNAAPLDLFNPVYDQPLGGIISRSDSNFKSDALGIYIQDQITLQENLKLLLGGRFDIVSQVQNDLLASTSTSNQQQVFSPRFGIVYQPLPPFSLYASYSQSFLPVGSAYNSSVLPKPEKGDQYEVGIKADLTNQLSANLAFYNLTRSNVTTSDPNNPLLSIQVGEQRSRGIEFDLIGEILPGWNIIAGYAYTDAEITQDNRYKVGNLVNNVPKNSFNLWTTYTLGSGKLKGLGFGLGLFYVGERQGDLANTFTLPSYVRTDAAIFYKQGQFRAALNFRNLFNIDYFESAQTNTRVFPSDPFTVQGTISWEF